MMIDRPKDSRLLSIGALARAAGVPPETLRTWERRYGFPTAERTTSGHRRYSLATLDRLRLVLSALKHGHRPNVALVASDAELHALLAGARLLVNPIADPRSDPGFGAATILRWIELIRHFDGRALERELRASIADLGASAFLTLRAAPLITEIGERWSRSDFGVRHEHFASERLNEFFISHWQPLSDASNGPLVVCATTSGERHGLGLQMAAFTLALAGVRVVYLGTDLPTVEIAQAVRQHAGRAVVLSAAQSLDQALANAQCLALRTELGSGVEIVVGGHGFAQAPDVVTHLDGLAALATWARIFAGASPN
jgi:methanogenic corrinoid protein MtbC1